MQRRIVFIFYFSYAGLVSTSRFVRISIASSKLPPHIDSCGRRLSQKDGLSGLPKRLHRLSSLNWTHRTPAGLPPGIPGIGELIEGAMQHAPQPVRQSMEMSLEFTD
jgi:hypothetical protein